MARLRIRVDLAGDVAVGPGKIRLLELVGERGSIAAAGRAMDMSYRRAWLLVDDLNHAFAEPVVAARPGGSGGGGAALTAFGAQLVAQYRALERDAEGAVAERLATLEEAARANR